MANLNDLKTFLKSDLAKGIAIGAGVAGVAAVALPIVAQAARPLLKSAIKTGILFAEVGREALAEAGETFEDIVAEVRSELAGQHAEPAEDAMSSVVGEELTPSDLG